MNGIYEPNRPKASLRLAMIGSSPEQEILWYFELRTFHWVQIAGSLYPTIFSQCSQCILICDNVYEYVDHFHSFPPSSIIKCINVWLVVTGTFFIFPYIGNFIIPIDFHIFQRGSNHQSDVICLRFFLSKPPAAAKVGGFSLEHLADPGGLWTFGLLPGLLRPRGVQADHSSLRADAAEHEQGRRRCDGWWGVWRPSDVEFFLRTSTFPKFRAA